MKTNIFKYGLGLLVSVLLVSSCADKFPTYTPVNDDVSWAISGETFPLSADETPIVINIQRGLANSAISVPVSITDENGVYTLSTSKVDFAAGEYSKTIQITYDYSTLTPGKSYEFTLNIPESQASHGCFHTFEGNGMMQLVYEDYKTATPYQYVYKGTSSWVYVKGCNIPDFEGKKAKLERAKGTTAYYKFSAYDGYVLEFFSEGKGVIVVKKYSGYNDAGTYTASNNRYTMNWGPNKIYFFQCLVGYCDIYTDTSTSASISGQEINSGNVLEFSGWFMKGNDYYPVAGNTTNTYMDWLID